MGKAPSYSDVSACTDHVWPMHSSIFGGCVCCVYFLSVLNNAALNVGVQVCCVLAFGSFGFVPRSGIAGSYCPCICNFFRNSHTVCHGSSTIYLPSRGAQGSDTCCLLVVHAEGLGVHLPDERQTATVCLLPSPYGGNVSSRLRPFLCLAVCCRVAYAGYYPFVIHSL